MAITKRFSVQFDIKMVFDTEDFSEFQNSMVKLSKQFLMGNKKLTGLELELARTAAEFGPEVAAELAFKSGMAESIREHYVGGGGSVGNIRVVVKS